MDKKILLLMFCMIFLFVSPMVSAKDVQVFTADDKVEILYPKSAIQGNGNDFIAQFRTFNKSSGKLLDNESCNCNLTLLDNQGNILYQESSEYNPSTKFWYNNISGNHFEENGNFRYEILCIGGDIDGGVSGTFDVNEGGILITKERSVIGISLLVFLFAVMMVTIFATFKTEHYIGKLVFYWVSHLFAILFTYSGWQLSYEVLLDSTGVVGIFQTLFYVVLIAVFPMFILSIAWIVYIHAFNEHFQKLVDDGEDPEKAFELTKRKKGGWLHGKK